MGLRMWNGIYSIAAYDTAPNDRIVFKSGWREFPARISVVDVGTAVLITFKISAHEDIGDDSRCSCPHGGCLSLLGDKLQSSWISFFISFALA